MKYLQHEHYALWKVIEFGDPYKAPPEETAKDKGLAGEVSASTKIKGIIVAITAEDMQKKKNDVKARTTLLLALLDEHQLRFNKYDTAKELWEAILKTFSGNEATKKTKKNQLKQQYGNFKAEGSETLEQTFNRLQAIVSHLEFMNVPIEQDDLNQKFLTSLAPEWLVYTIVWRNRDDLDTMSLDDVYNHLKVYEPEMGHFARECRSSRSQDRGKKESYKKDPTVEEPTPKEMIAIDGIGWDWSYMAEEDKALQNHALKDLSWMGLPEFVDDTVTDYTRPIPSIDISKSVSKELEERWKSNNPSFFEQGGSSGNGVSKPMIKFVKEYGCPNATKVNNTENDRKPTVKYAEMYKNTSQSPKVRGNQKNWNNQKSEHLGKDFMMQNKACYNCGSFDHLEFNCKHDIWVDKEKTWTRVNHAHDNMKYTSTHKSMTPRAVLLKSGTKPIAINRPFSTARPTLNSAQPKMTSFVKTAHSNVKRPFERKLAAKNKVWVPTVRPKIPTVGSKVPAAKPTIVANKGSKGKAVTASAR
nr:hypothetical protein [Tanacetum cinerariifolium]